MKSGMGAEMEEKKVDQRKLTGKKTLIIIGWLMCWQIACRIVDNPIFFSGPVEVVKELIKMAGSREFAVSVMNSLLRITGGFCVAFLLACLLAALAYHLNLLEDVLGPFVSFIKSVPVASVVVLLLIWFGAKYLSVYVTFMVVFPNIYINILTGLKNTDKELLEMAQVFRFSAWKKMLYIYRPAVMPYLLGGTKVSVGMSFKSGVAAEVIGLPAASIGAGLYNAKIYLNTAGVFAWTAVIVLLSSLIEWLAVWLLRQAGRQDKTIVKRSGTVNTEMANAERKNIERKYAEGIRKIVLEDISVSFGENQVLDHIDQKFFPDKVYCIMGASGSGKTTLLRVCAGLQNPDAGKVKYAGDDCKEQTECNKYGMTFQEDRLCMQLSAWNNILLTADTKYSEEEIRKCLEEILPKESLDQPAEQLSGGMKRRLTVARAMLSDAEYLMLDEPFTGLDEANHEKMCRWVLKNRNDRLLILTTHDEEDAGRMGAEIIRL